MRRKSSPETFEQLTDLAYESSSTRARFRDLTEEYRGRVERGEGEALKLALALLLLGKFRDALDWFAKTPDGKFRRYYAARAARALGRLDEALSELDQAIAKGWDRFDADMQAAAIRVQMGDIAEAQKAVEKHAQAGRDRAEWYYVQGLLSEEADEWVAALEQYEKALTLNPDSPEAMFRCAYLYDIHGEDAQAVELYERLALQPGAHVNALINLAVLYEDVGKYDRAIQCLERVLNAYPNHTRAACSSRTPKAAARWCSKRPAISAAKGRTDAGDGDLRVRAFGSRAKLSQEDEHSHAGRPGAAERARTAFVQEFR